MGILPALSGAHRFLSTKSFISLQLTQWCLQKLLDNTSSPRYYVINPLSMMTLSVHFHSTTHVKQILMSQLQYATEFMRSVKEALKRFYPWPGYYFKNRKGCCYPPAESCIDYRELSLVLPKKAAFVYIAVSNEEKWQTWADSYTRAVCKLRVRQNTAMAKTGTVPRYLYSNKISEVSKATEAYSADMVRSSDLGKEVLKRDWAT